MTSGDDAGVEGAAVGLARLLQFGDSMFPIGGFSFSGGLESAIQQRVVTDAATLLAFARTATAQAASGDGVALIHAHRAARAGDLAEVARIDELVFARKLSSENRTMSTRMGRKAAELGAQVIGAPLVVEWLRPHRERRNARLSPAVARGQLRGPGSFGARGIRGAPVRGRRHHPQRGSAADEDRPRRHAKDAICADRRCGRRLRRAPPRRASKTWPASRR